MSTQSILAEFDKEFKHSQFVDYAKIKSFLAKAIEEVREEERKKYLELSLEEKEWEETEEAHRTEQGYCCACEYDMAVMKEKISKAREEEREKVMREINHSYDDIFPKYTVTTTEFRKDK